MIEEIRNEGVTKEETVLYLKSKVNGIEGMLILTPNRIALLTESKNKFQLGGLVGAVINAAREKKYIVPRMNVELKDIQEITQGKHGLVKNVVELTTNSGETYRIIVKNYPEWEAAIKG